MTTLTRGRDPLGSSRAAVFSGMPGVLSEETGPVSPLLAAGLWRPHAPGGSTLTRVRSLSCACCSPADAVVAGRRLRRRHVRVIARPPSRTVTIRRDRHAPEPL